MRRLQYLEPSKDFRTDFQYNNAMFLTAGHLAEVVSGQSWEALVRERLFAPLGMKGLAGFFVEFKLDATGMPLGFDLDQPNGIFMAKRK